MTVGAFRLKRPDAIRSRAGQGEARSLHAIRADIVKFCFYAIRTERTFIATNARLHRIRRKVFVGMFAVGSDF